MLTFRLCGGAALLVAWAIATPPTLAQIKTDGSVGPRRALKGPDFRIDEQLGKRVGDNLFHSFEQFNIRTLGDGTIERATFRGANDIANVISRVTGASPSEINGLLRSEVGKADLWLINPNGVTFGPNARLDVPGSFHVSTADQLRLADGAAFSAADPDASTLTVAPPEAFGFLGDDSGVIESRALRLIVKPEAEASIALVGGNVLLDGSSIEAPGGTINVVGIGGRGEVRARDVAITSGSATGRVALVGGAILQPGGGVGDGARLRAGKVRFDFSDIRPHQPAEGASAGVVEIKARTLALSNESSVDAREGVRVDVQAGALLITSGSSLFTETASALAAGDIAIGANNIRIDRAGASSPTGIFSATTGRGSAGPVTIRARTVGVANGGRISSSTFGIGDANTVTIDGAERLLISGNGFRTGTGIFSNAEKKSSGAAGRVVIDADRVRLLSGGVIQSSTFGSGSAGSISITAPMELVISRDGTDVLTAVSTSAEESSTTVPGERLGGRIDIDVGELRMLDGGKIRSLTFSSKDAGKLSINADRITLAGGAQIFSGNILGTGNADNVTVTARESIEIVGQDRLLNPDLTLSDIPGLNVASPFPPSGIFASSETREGVQADAGDVRVNAPVIVLADRGEIASESFGQGAAGKVEIFASELLEITNAEVTTQAPRASGGEIVVNGQGIIDLREDAKIASTVAGERGSDAGNIRVASPRFLLLSESGILARADAGRGGEIRLDFGTGLRTSPDLVDASAGPAGISGTVALQGAEQNIVGDLVSLDASFVTPAELLAEACAARSGKARSSLTAAGKGGLAQEPGLVQIPLYLADREPAQSDKPRVEATEHGIHAIGPAIQFATCAP